MNCEYLLSIVILTMNRKDQVIEALDSCMASKMPENMEFVIVDNHSIDGTRDAIQAYIDAHPQYDFQYEYEYENLGVGGGRARGFDLARGKYLYFLDDDAVVAEESGALFFVKPIEFLEKNKNVASVTTQIKDTVFQGNRNDSLSKYNIDGKPLTFKFLGGSHFLRKSAFDSPIYFHIRYGSEEYAPSIIAHDKGFYHVYINEIYITHKPKVNKWIDGTADMEYVLCCGTAVTYATKLILYPSLFRPVLDLAYHKRCKMYLKKYNGAIEKCNKMVKEIVKNNCHKKIRVATVIKMYKNFGLTVF